MDDGAWLGLTLRTALADALALLLPVDCAGCDEPDVTLCGVCRRALRPHVTVGARGLRVWSGLIFSDAPARTVRALKEEGRTGLARELAPALRAAVEAALEATGEAASTDQRPASDIVLVPVPTSRAAFRRRGYRVVELVARRAGLRTARLLRPSRVTADQRGLGQDERRRNVAHSLRAKGAAGLRIILLDDVVTTGATLGEAARALQAGGAEVLGAATIAATPRHGVRRTHGEFPGSKQ